MSIQYKIDVVAALKEAGYTPTRIKKEKLLGESYMTQLRRGELVSWAAMNTYPLTMVSNALSGKHMGTYLGLFNCSICLPQIIASLLSFILFPLMKYSMPAMMLTAGISGILAAVCVLFIKETYKN